MKKSTLKELRSEAAKLLGSITSPKKAESSRANGRKPKKKKEKETK